MSWEEDGYGGITVHATMSNIDTPLPLALWVPRSPSNLRPLPLTFILSGPWGRVGAVLTERSNPYNSEVLGKVQTVAHQEHECNF